MFLSFRIKRIKWGCCGSIDSFYCILLVWDRIFISCRDKVKKTRHTYVWNKKWEWRVQRRFGKQFGASKFVITENYCNVDLVSRFKRPIHRVSVPLFVMTSVAFDHVSLHNFFFRGCGVRIWEPVGLVVFVLWITRFLSLETALSQNIVFFFFFYGGKAWFSKFTSHCIIIMFLQYWCVYWSEFCYMNLLGLHLL